VLRLAAVLPVIEGRGEDYFRQRIQPYLRDLSWIADWGHALLAFCDESWRSDLLQIVARLLNTPHFAVAMACVDDLLQDPDNVDAVMQTISDTGILDAQRWEELALLLMAHAPQVAMPVIENALQGADVALLPFLAVIDAEWSQCLLQRLLQDPRQRDPVRRLRLLTALSYSNDREAARTARRSLSELPAIPGRRSEQQRFKFILELIRTCEQQYASEPAEAAEYLSNSLSIYLEDNGVGWQMSAATGHRLLDHLVGNRLADVDDASDSLASEQGPQP
jgi:hypothetical protein